MAAPSFVGAGSGGVYTTGTGTAITKTGCTTGNLILLQVLVDGSTSFGAAISSISGVEDLGGTANALTAIPYLAFASGVAEMDLWAGRATSSTVSVTVSEADGIDCYARIYEFSGVAAGTSWNVIAENGASSILTDSALGSTINDVGVTTNGADRLAVQLVAVNDDNAVGAFTGMTGGTWAEAVAEYASATGTDGCLQLQTATMSSSGTINGGSYTMSASDTWGVMGFALRPTSSTQTITLGLLDAGAALYAPSISYTQTVTLGLLDASAALYAPTVAPAPVTLTLGLLDASRALYAPTLTVGPVTISLGLLDASATLYAPTVAQTGGTQDISLGLIDGSATLYAPTVTTTSYLVLGLIDASAALYAPTLTTLNTITLGLLDGAAALYAPTVTPIQTITLPLLEIVGSGGTPTVRNSSSYASSASETSIVVPVPSGVQDGDVMFCHIHVTASSGNITRNTAWTAIYENQFSGSSTSSRSSLFYRVASSEPTDYTWTIPSGRASASVVALYNVDTTTPVEASQVAVDSTAGTSITAPTVTSTDGTKLLTWHGGRTATTGVATTYTPDASMDSELVDVSSAVAASSNSSHEVAIDTVTAGASTGTRTATADRTVNWIAFSVIPKPAAGGPGTGVFAPTITAGPATITLTLLDASAALYAPELTQTGASPQDLTLGLLDAGATLYAPTLATVNDITIGLLDATSALYAPTLTPTNTLVLGLLDAGPALYAPTVIIDQFITLGLLDGGPALYAPTISTTNAISLGLIDASAALYAPTLLPVNTVALGLLDAGAALYAPELAKVGGTSQDISLGLLDAGAALYAPSLAVGPVGITLGLLDATSALYAPTLLAVNTITVPLLDGSRATYAPALAPYTTLVLDLLDSGSALYAPTLAGAAQNITLGLLDAGPALYQPTLAATNTITLDLLDGASDLYPPVLANTLATITGITRNQYGAPIGNCTVLVFRSSDNTLVATTTSNNVGRYTVAVTGGVEHFIVAYHAAKVYGVTARDVVGS